jgi:SpoVK/Ycf46/Vps4 family AAA+-type ATPase
MLKGSLVSNGTKPVAGGFSMGDTSAYPTLFAGALSRQSSSVMLEDVRMPMRQRSSLRELVTEFEKRKFLEARGIHRRSKLILHGPPGCGKSMAARALANEMKLPLFVVRFDSVIGAYLGQTAIHLRQLFQFAEVNQCVLLFDEIDALGKRRGSLTDVGELDRVVIALMQELELTALQGFVIATSNLAGSLDPAIWRRFHLAIELPRPTKRDILEFARAKSNTFNIQMSQSLKQRVAKLRNYAEAEAAVENEARRLALSCFE